jgi:hypothetical protein
MGHIHLYPSADILTWLYPNPSALARASVADCLAVMSGGPVTSCPRFMSGPFSGVLAQGAITIADLNGTACPGCSGLSSRTMPALVADMKSGQTYLIVHTEQDSAGKIQGDVTQAVLSTTIATIPLMPAATTAAATGSSTTEFYAVAGLAVVLLIAVSAIAARVRRPAS